MGNLRAIYSVGNSLTQFLRRSYPEDLRAAHSCDFRLFASGEIIAIDSLDTTTLSLYLYRVTVDEHLRHTSRKNTLTPKDIPLAVDLHYLLTVWAESALAEQVILAWAMRQLYQFPVLDKSALSPEANWNAEDIIHVIPAELSNEDLMRIWEGLRLPYRLSVSYIARVVQIDIDSVPDAAPVVAARFGYTDDVEEGRKS